jgi:YD repeat-containing protein
VQLTRLTVPGVIDYEYRYSATQNDGRITSRKEYISGEDITYQYDSLQRLLSAATTHTGGTAPQWGQSLTYDGFGNMTGQTVTAGSAP